MRWETFKVLYVILLVETSNCLNFKKHVTEIHLTVEDDKNMKLSQ